MGKSKLTKHITVLISLLHLLCSHRLNQLINHSKEEPYNVLVYPPVTKDNN